MNVGYTIILSRYLITKKDLFRKRKNKNKNEKVKGLQPCMCRPSKPPHDLTHVRWRGRTVGRQEVRTREVYEKEVRTVEFHQVFS